MADMTEFMDRWRMESVVGFGLKILKNCVV